jgi:hypothetical protein
LHAEKGVNTMYLVILTGINGVGVKRYESLTEAQEEIQELANQGCLATLAHEIPLRVHVEVEY